MYNKRKRKSFDELRKEVRNSFSPFQLRDLLNISSHTDVDGLIDKIKKFVGENQRGISSSQLRAVFDRIEQTSDISKVGFRSFLAFKIVSQREDGAKKTLLLLEELANRVTKENAETKEEVLQQQNRDNFQSTAEIIVAYHKYAETINLRNEERILKQAKDDFRGISNVKELLNLPTSAQLGKMMDLLKKFIAKNERGVTPHQLRKIHNRVLEANDLTSIKMLRPLFAYTVARQGNEKAQRLMLLIDDLVKSAEPKHFENLKKLIETIVAFHKYYQVVPRRKEEMMLDEVRGFFNDVSIELPHILHRKTQANFKDIEDRLKAFILRYQKDLSSSQIRRIYDMIKDLETANAIQMVRPRMGYAIARQKKDNPRKVLLLIEDLASMVKDENVKQYKELLEDIIAYHEYFEAIAL